MKTRKDYPTTRSSQHQHINLPPSCQSQSILPAWNFNRMRPLLVTFAVLLSILLCHRRAGVVVVVLAFPTVTSLHRNHHHHHHYVDTTTDVVVDDVVARSRSHHNNAATTSVRSTRIPRRHPYYGRESLLRLSSSNHDAVVSTTSTTTSTCTIDTTQTMKEYILTKIAEMSENDRNTTPSSSSTTGSSSDSVTKESQWYGSEEMVAYLLFRALRDIHTSSSTVLGMKGHPFVIRRTELESTLQQQQPQPNQPPLDFVNFFTMKDLQQALEDDFLDAARGSTDPRSGWKITDVSVPRGESFDEARMTYTDVCEALEKGTVIFNAAGAHIPKLAPICGAACDATSLPCALNMYITAAGKRTSAPPHTDKQDVCVIQTQGCKSWKVYAVPDPSIKPNADIFARGKGDDSLPLHILKNTSELLLDTTIYPGDVLFIPAGFPHTTSTVVTTNNENDDNHHDETSVHLTLGIDHHIWELDYLSVIRLAYRRMGRINNPFWDNVNDTNSNPFVGKVNLLPLDILEDVMAELPLGLLDADGVSMVDDIVKKAADVIAKVDPDCEIDINILQETVERIRQQGIELLDIHCDMYIAAIQEGRTREAEHAMTAHLNVDTTKSKTMTADRIQRLSLFRVKKYYDLINDCIDRLKAWSLADDDLAKNVNDTTMNKVISLGDKVEAELGGAFFPATVTGISDDGLYDVTFFDGDKESGLNGTQIRLLSVPQTSPSIDTSKMTRKQLKRWKKEQEKSLK